MRLAFLVLFLLSSSAFAGKVFCYKKSLDTKDVNPFIPLKGVECKGVYSAQKMEENGWKLSETQIIEQKGKFNHFYVFEKADEPIFNVGSFRSAPKVSKRFNFTQKETTIYDVDKKGAKIKIGGLKIGQSGVIVHKGLQENIILATAVVVNSTANSSTLKYISTKPLHQKAIPNTNLNPSSGDTFILNHLYGTSLLIVPNNEAKQIVQGAYKEQMFISEDFFAAYLRVEEEAQPTKGMIKDFCRSNNIGTIFLVADDRLFILDGNSFSILDTQKIRLSDTKSQMPFFSKIEPVSGSGFLDVGLDIDILDIDFDMNFDFITNIFSDEDEGDIIVEDKEDKEIIKYKVKDYNKYYLMMLGKIK